MFYPDGEAIQFSPLRNACRISPGNRSCQNPAEPWQDQSPGPVLTEGVGLLRTGVQITTGWFDPDQQHVPFDVFTGSCRASAREDLIE